MRPIDQKQLAERFCYRVYPKGKPVFESRSVSESFFRQTELAHVVVPKAQEKVLDAWVDYYLRLQAEGAPLMYQLRAVRWMRLWYVLSVNYRALYVLALSAEEFGLELSRQEFIEQCPDGRRELFPFTSPTFRMLRPPLLLLTNE